jgi:transcription termination/antitermination protein NusG
LALNEGRHGTTDTQRASAPPQAPWHVLWTRSHCESSVHGHLAARGFHPFLPKVPTWSWRAGRRHRIATPLFPGYLFLNDTLDRTSHVELRKTPGLAAVLGERWDLPAAVPPEEVESIRRLVESGAEVAAHPYLREGRRVRIAAGPLAGLEAVLVRHRPDKGLVVVSVHLLQRSVAVELDSADVAAA